MAEPECPACGSKHVQKSTAVVDSGTTHRVISQDNPNPSKNIFSSDQITGSEVSISGAAKRNAAPSNDDAILAAIAGGLIGVVFIYMAGTRGWPNLVILALTILSAVFVYLHLTEEKRQEEFLNYQRQWYCHSCGEIFHR